MESTEYKNEIQQNFENLDIAVKENKLLTIKGLLNDLPVQDISDYLEDQSDSDVKATLFRLLNKDKAVEVFEHLEYEEQDILINSLRQERIIEILENMDPDDRTDLFEEMPAGVVKKYIRQLSPEERLVATKLLGYPDDSVGRLMTTDYVAFRPEVTVRQAVDRLKAMALDKETIYHCYIIDSTRKLIGHCSLKMLLLAEWHDTLGEIMKKDVLALNAYQHQEEAAQIYKHYDLMTLPVLDREGRLVGIVTFDDLVDVIEEEATEDIHRMAAIVPEEHPYFDTSAFLMAGKRIIWLSILLAAQSFSGMIIGGYERSFESVVGLAMFIPMLLATGGNTGAQSSAIIIRSIAIGEIKLKHFFSVVGKEIVTGFTLGVGLCILGIGIAFVLGQPMHLAVVLGISLCMTVIAAAIIGGSLPLLFQAMKLDPALMSGPFITTLVDIIGLMIYFETFRITTPLF